MSREKTPYHQLPRYSFWRDSVALVEPLDLDPVVDFGIRINRDTRVATAGSCFAQHIARNLVSHGYNYYLAEPPHPLMTSDLAVQYNYGTFSARYGNIYTSRQLLQLVRRAFGDFTPVDSEWFDSTESCWIDPFRPNIQPGGFSSREELLLDRARHLDAVRNMLQTVDVFVFTLGLTECWANRSDGAVYPLCPGVAGGTYDATQHMFVNLTVDEVIADLNEFMDRLHAINPECKVILTVSPVPLIATAAKSSHVLTATTYSKAVLRIAAETICRQRDDVAYFPSLEIITSTASRGRYFAANCRDVTEEGVSHVMRLFFEHATQVEDRSNREPQVKSAHVVDGTQFFDKAQQVVDTICEENLIEQHVSRRQD